ncbi:MAG: maleylpyruvate isomerase family mycothiol-dependent enzyme [Actinomycetota bacterium]|nr:maleylpyruvate isomerase family mycothiol-dependent enzyme [Actinomycetota bacterium]
MTTLDRAETSAAFVAELDNFGQLIASLDEAALDTPTRCAGWTVRDVAGHMVGQMTDVVEGRLDGLGSPEVTERQAKERAGRSGKELAAELAEGRTRGTEMLALFDDAAWNAPVASDFTGTLGDGILALYFDAYLHADDIRAALAMPSARGEGVGASVHHVADALEAKPWGPATLALDGVDVIDIRGGGDKVTGDPLEFVLVGTGRADPSALGLDESVNIYG